MTVPISFLLGAGASYPYGVPMMRTFYSEFRAHVERRHPHCFGLVKSLEERTGHGLPDLETLLSDLQVVVNVEAGLTALGKDSREHGEIAIARELRGYLDAFIVDRCERFDREKVTRELGVLLNLRTVAPLWIFSTNYDRIVEYACESNGIMWADGFQTGAPQAVVDWSGVFDKDVRLVKLHGSVNWYEDDPGGAIHRLDRGYPLPAHDFRLQRGSQVLRPLMIIPTLEKAAMQEPYIGLSVHLTDVLKESRVLVVAGNSLRDKHLKAYIKTRLERLRVLIVSPSAAESRESLGNPERTYVLNAGFSEFLTLGGTALLELAKSVDVAANDIAVDNALTTFISDVSRVISDRSTLAGSPEVDSLWRQIETGGVAKRIEAVKGLARYTHPAIIGLVSSVLEHDPSPAVRVAAIDALAGLARTGAVASLAKALLDDQSEDVQMESVLALAALGIDPDSKRYLLEKRSRGGISPALASMLGEALEGAPAD